MDTLAASYTSPRMVRNYMGTIIASNGPLFLVDGYVRSAYDGIAHDPGARRAQLNILSQILPPSKSANDI
jgi:hypothetical protein